MCVRVCIRYNKLALASTGQKIKNLHFAVVFTALQTSLSTFKKNKENTYIS